MTVVYGQCLDNLERVDEYREFLDDCGEPVDVLGFEYPASEALEALDPIRFYIGHTEWLESLEQEEEQEKCDYLAAVGV